MSFAKLLCKKSDKHPGFASVTDSIAAKEGVTPETAAAILASSTRNASPAAKKKNPKLVKVKSDISDYEEVDEIVTDLKNDVYVEGTAFKPSNYSNILKGKGPQGQSWKLVGGKRVYSSSGAAPAATAGDTPELSQSDKDDAHRTKYEQLDSHHDAAYRFHKNMAVSDKHPFTDAERDAHREAAATHRSASVNAQYAIGTMNKETNGLYTNRQPGMSAAAQAATDKTTMAGSGKVVKDPAVAPTAAQGVNHPADHVAAANTMLQQYGGNKFRAMTGAKDFLAAKEKDGSPSLTFKIPTASGGATKGVSHVRTILRPNDTYDVHMLGVRKKNGIPEVKTKHVAEGLYADQLQEHFKHHTGLDTHL